MRIIFGSRIAHYLARVSVFLITAALIAGMAGCGGDGSQNLEIRDWYDLDTVKNNLDGNHNLMNDLDSTTEGYEELASPTANGGKGWQPIGRGHAPFTGSFDGQGYEIHDLVINRPDEEWVGLFGIVDEGGVIENIRLVNVTVIGEYGVAGLVGSNIGTVSNSSSTGSVMGDNLGGGLVGENIGAVSHSHSSCDVTAMGGGIGGLVGDNFGHVSNSYSTGSVTGLFLVGGLVAASIGTVSDSYSIGNVTGYEDVGGLAGANAGTLSNSYAIGNVTGNENIGGLLGRNLGTVANSYSTGNVTGDGSAIGGLVGENGYYGPGTVSNSYATGSVAGNSSVGGLVGMIYEGNVSNSYSTGNVTGLTYAGGLVGENDEGTVSNSFWDTQTSGQATSDGGTGKNTTEMNNIATFSGAGWNITAVDNPGTRNPSYIWNIVDDVTYPFLSWQP